MRFSYKKGLAKLTEYAVNEGYMIKFNHIGTSMIKWYNRTLNEPKAIYIQSDYTLEFKTYLLLHELGHHELRKDWIRFEKRLPLSAYAEHVKLTKKDKRYMRRDSYIVSSLEEEFLAWDEGLKLAKILGIKVNLEKWMDFRSRCLKSYIGYYANIKK